MPRNVRSFVVTDNDRLSEPGAIRFAKAFDSDAVVGFTHACPCGCGRRSFIRLNLEHWAPGTTPMWSRTGDDLHMTLSPSIGIHPVTDGTYHWHGYLRDGVFEEC